MSSLLRHKFTPPPPRRDEEFLLPSLRLVVSKPAQPHALKPLSTPLLGTKRNVFVQLMSFLGFLELNQEILVRSHTSEDKFVRSSLHLLKILISLL